MAYAILSLAQHLHKLYCRRPAISKYFTFGTNMWQLQRRIMEKIQIKKTGVGARKKATKAAEKRDLAVRRDPGFHMQ